jgi:hypothetical protein
MCSAFIREPRQTNALKTVLASVMREELELKVVNRWFIDPRPAYNQLEL